MILRGLYDLTEGLKMCRNAREWRAWRVTASSLACSQQLRGNVGHDPGPHSPPPVSVLWPGPAIIFQVVSSPVMCQNRLWLRGSHQIELGRLETAIRYGTGDAICAVLQSHLNLMSDELI